MIPDDVAAQTTILYDKEEGKVVVPHTFAAAQYWGQGTQWCITEEQINFDAETRGDNPALIFITPDGNKTAVCNHRIYNASDNHLYAYQGTIVPLRDAMLNALPKQRDVLYYLLLLERDLKNMATQPNSPKPPYIMDGCLAEFTEFMHYKRSNPHALYEELLTTTTPETILPYLRFVPTLWGSPTIFGPPEAAAAHLERTGALQIATQGGALEEDESPLWQTKEKIRKDHRMQPREIEI